MAKASAHSHRTKGFTSSPLVTRVSVVILTLSLAGCGFWGSPSHSATKSSRGWLQDGSLAISRPVPPVNSYTSERASLRTESLPEQAPTHGQTVVRISRAAGKVTVSGTDGSPVSFNAHVARSLRPGQYSISLKQNNPLWYAPASYFRQRDMRVPAEGSRERFKRGALGNQALFLNDQTPLHSGPVGSSEIGGLRLNPEDMSELFELVAVGTVVEVR